MAVTFEVLGEREQVPLAEAPFHQWFLSDQVLWTSFHRVSEGYVLRFPGFADYEIDDSGRHVRAWSVPGASLATVEHLYLNQVYPLALSRQGKLVLHGSAVEIGEKSVAFIGVSGQGKSTLAASFATTGHRFLTDDGLLLEWQGDTCCVMPSHPSIRLWGDSQDALMARDAPLAPQVQFTNKARFLAGREVVFCDQARPLQCVYFLAQAESKPRFERIRPAQAMSELVKNSFLLDIDARDMLASHFDAISRLGSLPIYYRLYYPRNYEDLPNVRQAIVAHVSEESEVTQ